MQPPVLPSEVDRNTFPEIDDQKLKALYSDHRSIQAVSILWILGSIVCLLIGIGITVSHDADVDPLNNYLTGGAFIGGSLFYLVFTISVVKRLSWGRAAGMVLCVLSLPGFPVGTIVGVLGLVSFARSPELFGNNRLNPDELKLEYNQRRKAKK